MINKQKTRKGDRTRARILDTALGLFLERGYEKTTMREIAGASDVSVGNAYYYFASKEHLVQGFYALTHAEHLAAIEPELARLKSFQRRLERTLTTKIKTADPYHSFSGILFKSAADPKSPLNPFSSESQPTRDEGIELMRRIVDGSKERVPKDLAGDLPRLLWLYMMAIILFWLHDESEGRARTHKLIKRTSDIVARLVKLSSNPLMRPLRRSALKLVEDLSDPGR